ncbi:MAG TPA: helix-hairpin-helix domain-containing protein [Patescibacteria group bacterium]|nr:helix-hairpin-helix domain-containing protein [Patescibacteria group bacterium]
MFNFTGDERRIILCVTAFALLGALISVVLKTNSRAVAAWCADERLGKVDLNRADTHTLMSVKGIGAKLAERIVAYRQEQGGFSSTEELKNVEGIYNWRYEKIKDAVFITSSR